MITIKGNKHNWTIKVYFGLHVFSNNPGADFCM